MVQSRNLNFIWTDEADTKITQGRQNGRSAAELARDLSALFGQTFTRCAIIGRWRRLGLSGPRPECQGVKKGKGVSRDKNYIPPSRREGRPKRPARDLSGFNPDTPGPLSCGILYVVGCRYPVGVGLFCNAPGKPFCEKHREIAYRGNAA